MKLTAMIFALVFWLPGIAYSQTYLLMAEEEGCYWCGKWNNEISHIYPKTAEGQAAPLKRFNLRVDKPNVNFKGRVVFTPTFILVKDGTEIGRIEGYPGEDFFWSLLSEMLTKANMKSKNTG